MLNKNSLKENTLMKYRTISSLYALLIAVVMLAAVPFATAVAQGERQGFFIACYDIGGNMPGAPLFNVNFGVNTVDKTVAGLGHITQATNPPLDIRTHLDGNYTYMTVMPRNVHILITATGYPPINWSPFGGVGPVIPPNVYLQMVLTEDWKSGTANYKYVDNNGNWHNIENTPVKSVPCNTMTTTNSANVVSKTPTQAIEFPPCPASSEWVTNPNPPSEIPGNGANFCEFYQFAWQWFIYLMAPSSSVPGIRNFQDTAEYPILQASGTDSCSENASSKPQLFVRIVKDNDAESVSVVPERVPERIDQAGNSAATIYDQNKNVVFYTIQFDKGLCSASDSGDLPIGTLELKMAWRVISEADKANYVWMYADIIPTDGNDVKDLLGLIGFHLAKGTAQHPEFVWASYEHKNNAPNCVDSKTNPLLHPEIKTTVGGWSFTSNACVTCLNEPTDSCLDACNFNQAQTATSLTGTPTEICRVFHDGTAALDYNATLNIADIDTLNEQLVGIDGIITKLGKSKRGKYNPLDNPLAVLANYFNLGAIWVSNPEEPATPSTPSTLGNQRGSLQLANPVMETTYQGKIAISDGKITNSTNGVTNCFGCHNYQPGKTATSGLSHIFGGIQSSK
jgi:hypothetical protein